MTDASIHDISSPRRHRDSKRRTEGGGPTHDAKLVASVLEQIKEVKYWKLDKRTPSGRSEVIRLARNLYGLLARVPHGEKKDALVLAAFGDRGTESAAKYAPNISLSPAILEVSDKYFRRLSLSVGKYISAARR